MNKSIRNTLLGTVTAALVASAAMTANAQNEAAQSPTLAIAFADAVEIARATVAGEPRGAELEDEDGMPVWEVEMLTADGQEVDVLIDASSGSVLTQVTDEQDDEQDDD